jgi:hypothetical protein
VPEITTGESAKGYDEAIRLLDAIEPVLVNVVMQLALGKGIDRAENFTRHVPGAGVERVCQPGVKGRCNQPTATCKMKWIRVARRAERPKS